MVVCTIFNCDCFLDCFLSFQQTFVHLFCHCTACNDSDSVRGMETFSTLYFGVWLNLFAVYVDDQHPHRRICRIKGCDTLIISSLGILQIGLIVMSVVGSFFLGNSNEKNQSCVDGLTIPLVCYLVWLVVVICIEGGRMVWLIRSRNATRHRQIRKQQRGFDDMAYLKERMRERERVIVDDLSNLQICAVSF